MPCALKKNRRKTGWKTINNSRKLKADKYVVIPRRLY